MAAATRPISTADPPGDGRCRIGSGLARYPHLWAYAQSLYDQEAFQLTTAPATFVKA